MITTLTLNPAFDVHVGIDEFRAGRENLADSVKRDVGGKGINISRALSANKIENLPLVLLGQENAADFLQGLEAVGLHCSVLECPGRIRENITVHPTTGPETRLSFKGFRCTPDVLDRVAEKINPTGTVTFTGSLPGGISAEEAEIFLTRLRDAGARVVIDSKSIPLDMLRRIRPWLIKPNAEEIEAYFGGEMTEARLCDIASELHAGGIENVMISLGGDGAILASEGRLFRARVPAIPVLSTIGAGDSSIAGFVGTEGSPEDRLRTAVAYGSAACLREGTAPPLPNDIARIAADVTIELL